MSKFSDDKILLKLYRTYGKDEALKYLFDEISRLKFHVGELKSEVAELKDNKPEPEKMIERLTIQVKDLEGSNKAKNKKNDQLMKRVVEWREKYFNLIAKTGKL